MQEEQRRKGEVMPAGRPTLYKPEYCDEIVKFFDVEAFTRETYKDGNGAERTRIVPCTFPTLARFASKIDVDRDTLKEWANKTDSEGNLVHPEFSAAYKKAKDLQEAILIEGGIAGAYETPFAIFTAKNVIGWNDKQSMEHSGPNGGPLTLMAQISGAAIVPQTSKE